MSQLPQNSREPDETVGRRRSLGRGIWIGAAVLALALLVLLLFRSYPGVLDFREDGSRLVYLVILALIVGGSSALLSYRIRHAVRDAAIWIVILVVLVIGYSFRDDLTLLANRLTGELAPTAGVARGNELVIRRAAGGHFQVDAAVDGRQVRFLVDTGASQVTLSKADAQRLGYAIDRLQFGWPAYTANGTVYGARIRIGELRVGPITVRDVAAMINGGEMHGSLLGMSFLDRLQGYEVRGDALILRP